jgi:Tol biopolymer transport system component
MTLSTGSRLGPYEVISPLGAGGMGEVYRARDTRLDRTVAIKVLPSRLASSPEARQRFEREAKTISTLSHPHICALYDVGREGDVEYLVMEYLEGETLADRLSRGPLALDQTIKWGMEIADALDRAHRQGIVHRDLKPGNVMLTRSGVKLLDFGLAKAVSAAPQSALTSLPTAAGAANLTQEGTILGTFQYMAPEQLEGKEADSRTDIFALGAVLYEMAAGKKAFFGTSQASLISAIMTSEPPALATLQPMTPPALERAVKTCLAKDPEERWQSAADVKRELQWIGEGSSAGVAVPAPVRSRRRLREALAWGLAALGLLGAVALLWTRRPAQPPQPIRFILNAPAGTESRYQDRIAVSPEGRRLAFIAQNHGGQKQLWIQSLDSLNARRLEGTDGALLPFWSRDGRQIAFFQNGKLRRIGAEGGTIQTISEAAGSPFGGAWGGGDRIVFASDFGTGLWMVPASGGPKTAATVLDRGRGDAAHLYPAFLPDGRHFVFAARNVDPRKTVLVLGDLDSKGTRVLWQADTNAVWADPDFLLFVREGTLFAQRFDVARDSAVGDPVPVADDVLFQTNTSVAQVSAGGSVLVYGLWRHDRRLVWVDRRGREVGTLGQIADYEGVRISPSGTRVAVSIRDPSNGRNLDIWVLDAASGVATRITSERSDEFDPTWSPDGQRLFYASDRAGFYDVYSRPSAGGAEELVLRTNWDKLVEAVTHDGREILFVGSPQGHAEDIWSFALAPGSAPKAVIDTPEFAEYSARLSPDGRWLAFSSDEPGNRAIFVQPFPTGPRRPVSSSIGESAVWSRDGKELYYVAGDRTLTSVGIHLEGSGLRVETPEPLFPLLSVDVVSFEPRTYDVSPDGRFLIIRRASEEPESPVVVDVGWTARLKR